MVYIVYIDYIHYKIAQSCNAKGKSMDIIITNSDGTPIYEQISSQIKKLIMNGKLKAGDPLPSMRLLAKELRISLITTKRAYEELERDGFIQSFTGKGSFVASQNPELLREEHLRQTEEHLKKAVAAAKTGSITLDELTEMLTILFDGEEN